MLLAMWKENHYGWLLRGVIWFYLAIVGSCAVIGLQPDTRRTEGVTHRMEAVTELKV
jgi:hypothetical protein